MFEHGSGSIASGLHGLHAEVAQHGVKLPLAKELQ